MLDMLLHFSLVGQWISHDIVRSVYFSVSLYFYFSTRCQRLSRFAGVIFIRILFENFVKFPKVALQTYWCLKSCRKKSGYVESCMCRLPVYGYVCVAMVGLHASLCRRFDTHIAHTHGPYHYITKTKRGFSVRAMVKAWGTYMRLTRTDFDFNAKVCNSKLNEMKCGCFGAK